MSAAWYRVLVVGAQKTGKTTLLSTTVAGDYSSDYNPTSRVESYFDTKLRIEFIDTPGIQDSIINSDGTEGSSASTSASSFSSHPNAAVSSSPPGVELERLRKVYSSFSDDPLVKELSVDHGKAAVQLDVDLLSIDAILVVYTDDVMSKRIAKALRMVLLSRPLPSLTDRKTIFFLHNYGIQRPKPTMPPLMPPKSLAEYVMNTPGGEKNDGPMIKYLFDDSVDVGTDKLVSPIGDSIAQFEVLPAVSAVSGEGVDAMWTQFKERLADPAKGGAGGANGAAKGRTRAAGKGGYNRKKSKNEQQRFCTTDRCIIS